MQFAGTALVVCYCCIARPQQKPQMMIRNGLQYKEEAKNKSRLIIAPPEFIKIIVMSSHRYYVLWALWIEVPVLDYFMIPTG